MTGDDDLRNMGGRLFRVLLAIALGALTTELVLALVPHHHVATYAFRHADFLATNPCMLLAGACPLTFGWLLALTATARWMRRRRYAPIPRATAFRRRPRHRRATR